MRYIHLNPLRAGIVVDPRLGSPRFYDKKDSNVSKQRHHNSFGFKKYMFTKYYIQLVQFADGVRRPLPYFHQHQMWFALVVALQLAFISTLAGACMLCVPGSYPKTTLADTLLQSKTVVMARERRDKARTFYAVEFLKGAIDGNDFHAFVNPKELRMLRQQPEDVVVFRRENLGSNWQYIAYADNEYQEFIRSILGQSSKWQKIRGSRDRIDFFAERLKHSNQQIKEQAHLEVSRAPYASIKRIAGTIPRQQIREFLGGRRFFEWHRLYILMLGQSRHPDDIAYIRRHLESAAAYGLKTNLSAWVTAFIETNPETGVEEIENLYFSNKSRTKNELQEICMSLSVLGSEAGYSLARELFERRNRIVHSYDNLLENYPQMAGPVAKDLTIWQIRAHVERLTQIRDNESALNPDSKMAITYYLSISQGFPHITTAQ